MAAPMALFSICAFKIIPLYVYIFLGFIAGRLLDAHRDTIARLMLYIINPIVIFNGIIHTRLDTSVLTLPVMVFFMSSGLCLVFYRLSRYLWQDSTCSLAAFSAGSGNTGYFGLSIAILLFNDQGEGLYIMAILGVTFFESTIGYYIFARETMSAKECAFKLLKLPALYAFFFGLFINALQLPIPEVFDEFMHHIKGTYTVLGMMIIGLGLASLSSLKLDFKFIGITFLAKFVAWPLLIMLTIQGDRQLFHFFNESIYKALMLLAIVPLGANMVVMASLMHSYPDKAAAAVVLSILLALIYVPFMAEYFIC